MRGSEPTAPSFQADGPDRVPMETVRRRWLWILPLALAITVLAVWQGLVTFHVLPAVVLPAPRAVWTDLQMLVTQGFQGQTLWSDIWISAARIITGFLAAVVIGVPLGLWMGTNLYIFKLVDPVLQFVRPVPPLAYIPLMVVWFGIGELSKAMVILLGTIPIIMISALAGVRSTPRQRVLVAQCLGANPFQVFRYVILPSSLPDIFTGMRVGIGVAWTCLVAAEMIGASSGLGWLVQIAGQDIQVGVIFVGIVAIGALGYFMELAIRLIERRVVPWRGQG
jgi:ABC-type nitrate/sulfonate/bicarbonate transport system permease component